MCEFSEARQCAKVILGVGGTAAAFLVTFSAAGKSNSHSRLEREAIIKMHGKITGTILILNLNLFAL